MKRNLFTLFCILAASAMLSCTKTEGQGGGTDKESITIPAGQDTPVFDTKGSVKSVVFITTADWTASIINNKADGWISISPASGSKGENSLFITTTDNTETEERSATIEIRCGDAKRQIIATQKQKDALTVTKSKYEVGATGGVVTIEVKANVDYAVSIDDKCVSWVSKQQTKSMVSTTFQLVVSENPELEKREGKVTVSSGVLFENIYIYQAGATPAIVITQNEYIVPSSGETIEVQVSHNVSATCVMPQGVNWITEVQTKAMSTNKYSFVVSENAGLENREAEIKFVNTENGLAEYVKVIQMQKDELVVAKSVYEIDDKGGEITVRVGHNIDFDIEIDGAEWISRTETKAFVQDDIVFNVAQNLTYDNREGSITFISRDKTKQQVVKIYQGQINAIILDSKSRIVPTEGETFRVQISHNVDVTVKPLVSWLHQVQTKSLVSESVEIAADANNSYDNREGKVVFINTLKGVSDTLTVTQLQKDAIVVAKSEYNMTSKGGQIEVTIGHNIEFDTEISDSWITETTTKSFITETLCFNVAENPTYDNRQATITFTSKDKTKKQTITVYQGQINAIILGRRSQVVSAAGESFEVGVNSNVSLSVKTTASWLHHTQTKALVGNTLMFTASANTSVYERTAEAIVYNTASGVSDTLKVTQLQKDAIVVAKSEYYVERKGESISVEIGHNVNFLTNINVGWITETTTKSFITDKLTYTISENTTGSDRTGQIKFTSYDGTCSQIIRVVQSGTDIMDLSAAGTANCYIVNRAGTFKFKATVKGNSTESVGTPTSAAVLWESFGTDVAPSVGDIISSASYSDGYITISTPATLANGNAVIAAKNSSGTILWSWHIWVCKDFDPVATAQVYNNNAGTMMDRNLGATSATPGNVCALGLFYQWGRKDPFISYAYITGSSRAKSTCPSWPNTSASKHLTNNNTLNYAIENPTTFIGMGSTSHRDWYCTDSKYKNDNLWAFAKTKYDPCPNGWQIPNDDVWVKSLGTNSSWTNKSNYNSVFRGMDFSKTDRTMGSGTIWYPTTGWLAHDDGDLQDPLTCTLMWSYSTVDDKSIQINTDDSGTIQPTYADHRSSGAAVRCQKQ